MRLALVDIPVDPDAPEARDWLLDELSKQPYQAAKPTFFDLVAEQILNWLSDVFDWIGSSAAGPRVDGPLWLVAIAIPIAVILILAFVVYGLPRLNRRSRVTGALFGNDDERDAASLRRDAERAAADGDFSAAITELFRSIARGLAERTLVSVFPGTTAHGFAEAAAGVFPDTSDRLASAAADFDGVRYLDRPGTREQWEAMVALERDLRAARVALRVAEPA